jgi:hypothetical protein
LRASEALRPVGPADIADKSTKQPVSVGFKAPPLTQLIGNSAE